VDCDLLGEVLLAVALRLAGVALRERDLKAAVCDGGCSEIGLERIERTMERGGSL